MTREQLDKYRGTLQNMLPRIEETAARLEDEARTGVGGDAGGNLSNAPMHLGDLGSAVYTQELNATLLENEAYLRDEVRAALGRIDAGTFGRCENCGTDIPPERLDILPYVRYCVPCAESIQDGPAVNINVGRPQTWIDPADPRGGDSPGRMPETSDFDTQSIGDVHAAGTPGGGTAVGGLAGTTVGDGSPDDADLNDALGSGNFDVALAADDPIAGDEATGEPDAYGGPTGGAVGGTPAGKRARGGRTGGGLEPRPGKGDSPTGP